MKLYLSSYKFGNEVQKLNAMLLRLNRIAHINNAQDFTGADPLISTSNQLQEIEQLKDLGAICEPLDLKQYFGKEDELRKKFAGLDGVWISGGNTFVLRQAMRLSGFDILFDELKSRQNFLYAGYSAGICVLCDSLKYIAHVDDPNDFPYEANKKTIWEGLNFFNYGLLPHYDSDHYESKAIGEEIQTCIKNKWLFKVLKDGEVIIIE